MASANYLSFPSRVFLKASLIGVITPAALIKDPHLLRTKSGAPLVKAYSFSFYLDTVVMHLVSEENGKTLTIFSLFLSYLKLYPKL